MSSTDRVLAWVAVLLATAANIAGYALNLYGQWAWFDEVLHAFTIFALALLAAVYLYHVAIMGARTRSLLFVLVVASIGLAIGGAWEVAEWVYDQIASGNVIKGKRDTIIDLVMDAIGGALAGWVAHRMAAR